MKIKKILSILIVVALLFSMMTLAIEAKKPGGKPDDDWKAPKVTHKPPVSVGKTPSKPITPISPVVPTLVPIVPLPFYVFDVMGVPWDMSSYYGYGYDYGYGYGCDYGYGYGCDYGCGYGYDCGHSYGHSDSHSHGYDCGYDCGYGWTDGWCWDTGWSWGDVCYTGHCTYKCNHTGYFSHCTDKCNHTGYYNDYYKYPKIIGGKVEGYIVSYNCNGGTLLSPQYYSHGAPSSAPSIPVRTGWIFGGWYADENCIIKPYDFGSRVTMSFILHAKWIKG